MEPKETRRRAIAERFPEWPRRTVAAHFDAMCRDYADRPLVLMPEDGASYARVRDDSRRLAKALIGAGIRRRDHVAVIMGNRPEFLVCVLALARIGAVCIPVNTMWTRDEIGFALADADVTAVISESRIGRIDYRAVLEAVSDRDDSRLRRVVLLGGPRPERLREGWTAWEALLDQADRIDDADLARREADSQYPDEVVWLLYTSGTTGHPKGVMLSHDMLLRSAYSTTLSRAFNDGRRMLFALPLHHIFALVEGTLAATFVGGCIIPQQHFAPRQALDLIERFRADDFLCVPSMLVALLSEPSLPDHDIESLQAAMCAAAPAPATLWERAIRELGLAEICTGYGMTEAAAATMHTEPGDPVETVATRVGRIKPGGVSGLPEFGGANIQYKTVDPHTLENLPAGEEGELCVRGNTVSRGYYRRPGENGSRIDKDGWLRTGDLGILHADGYLELTGRSDELYKVSGENVVPKEIEQVLTRHPAVNQAYVVGVADPVQHHVGCAFIELRPGETLTRREVLDWCRRSLAKFKIPRHVFFVDADEWPTTSTGKIQKFRLAEQARDNLSRTRTGSR
ncbi:MAG TPA: class I adenylate-forming enzyme family protein [Gammaproteobacteria bacterium]|nr:class I adenylate-forming enzyme family protein [Gammaproteobacteria bacterium]